MKLMMIVVSIHYKAVLSFHISSRVPLDSYFLLKMKKSQQIISTKKGLLVKTVSELT